MRTGFCASCHEKGYRLISERDKLRTPRPRDTWHEDLGSVLWWKLPVTEPPYAGTPEDDDFPDYATHWTPIPIPMETK